jgi:hypothetical protein
MNVAKKLCLPVLIGAGILVLPLSSVAIAQTENSAAKPVRVAAVGSKTAKPASNIKEPVTAKGCIGPAAAGKPYFVEFRSRTAASYGHAFLFYGRLGGGARFGAFQVAGLHPAGDSAATYVAGHVVPVAAETGVSDGDLDEQYLTARWCVPLTEAEFGKVSATIKKLQATKTTWHAVGYNCTAFLGDVAQSIGLKIPSSHLVYPEVYVNSLRELNRNGAELSNVPYVQWGMRPPAASPPGRL